MFSISQIKRFRKQFVIKSSYNALHYFFRLHCLVILLKYHIFPIHNLTGDIPYWYVWMYMLYFISLNIYRLYKRVLNYLKGDHLKWSPSRQQIYSCTETHSFLYRRKAMVTNRLRGFLGLFCILWIICCLSCKKVMTSGVPTFFHSLFSKSHLSLI